MPKRGKGKKGKGRGRHGGGGVAKNAEFKSKKKFDERNWKMAIVPDGSPRSKYTPEQRQIIEAQVQKLQQEIMQKSNMTTSPYTCILHENTNFIFCRGRLLQLELKTVIERLSVMENFPKPRLITKKEYELFCGGRGPWIIETSKDNNLAIVVAGYPILRMSLTDSQRLTSDIASGPVKDVKYMFRFEHSILFAKCPNSSSKERLRAFVSTLNYNGVKFVGLNDDHTAVNLGKAYYIRNSRKNDPNFFPFKHYVAVVSKEYPRVAVRQNHLKNLNRKAQLVLPPVKFIREDTLLGALFICESQYVVDWVKDFVTQDPNIRNRYKIIEMTDLEPHKVCHGGIVTYNGPVETSSAPVSIEENIGDDFDIQPSDYDIQGCASSSIISVDSQSSSSGSESNFNADPSESDFNAHANESNFNVHADTFRMAVVPNDYPHLKLTYPQYSVFKTEMEKYSQNFQDVRFHDICLQDGVILIICEEGPTLDCLHNIVGTLNSYGSIPQLVIENPNHFANW